LPSDPTKETDDVAGLAHAAAASAGEETEIDAVEHVHVHAPDPDALADPPPHVRDLALACVRYVAGRYRATLDFEPDTLSLLDQWLREARAEARRRPEVLELAQSTAGAYLGEVIRRQFGARWVAEGEASGWRLCLSTVYCAFNPVGMAREALLVEPAEGWHAHLELDPAEGEALEARLAALPAADDDEYYAPSTRFDVLCIVVDALRAGMQSRGLDDVRFSPEDY
jgi:hypothetical protein